MFGVVGGTVFPLFTATVGRQVQIVMAKHETGAAFMADGYARASGGLGACVATSGTRRHQPPHGGRRRLRGLDPDRRAHGAGRDEVLRARSAPGVQQRGRRHRRRLQAGDALQHPHVQGRPPSRDLAQGAADGARRAPGTGPSEPARRRAGADGPAARQDEPGRAPGADVRPRGDQAGGAAPPASAVGR